MKTFISSNFKQHLQTRFRRVYRRVYEPVKAINDLLISSTAIKLPFAIGTQSNASKQASSK